MNVNRLTPYILSAGLLVAVAEISRYAEHNHLVGPHIAQRATLATGGLVLAFYGNAIPKSFGAWRNPEKAKRAQSAMRVGGWSFVLAGLAYAGLWAFAPLATADLVSTVVVASATILTLGYTIWTYALCRNSEVLGQSNLADP